MANRPALNMLEEFNKAPSAFTASKLVGIPVLLAVLEQHKETYPVELLDVCQWLYQRGHSVLHKLIKHCPDEPLTMAKEDWCKVFVPNLVSSRSIQHSNFLLDWMLLQYASDSRATKVSLFSS